MAQLTCRDFVELVTDYLEGALDEDTKIRFEQHIAVCARLRDLPAPDGGDSLATRGDPSRDHLRRDAADAALRLPRLPPLTISSLPHSAGPRHLNRGAHMPDVEFTNLLVVAVIALLAPLTLGLAPALRFPSVVLEIIAGVVVGPQVLGWVEVDVPVSIVALLGLAFLLFLAGLEIDVHRLRGQVLRLALVAYLVTLVLGIAVGFGLDAAGWVSSPGLVAVALSATSLGLVVPVLKDAGKLDTRLGQTTVAAASVADFAAIVLLSLLFSTSDTSTGSRLVLLGTFAALVATTAVVVSLVAKSESST